MKQILYYPLLELLLVELLVLSQVVLLVALLEVLLDAGKAWAKGINKRGYGIKGGKGRKGSMVRPASDMPTFSPYATLYSPQNHPFTPQSSFQNGGSGERIM